jgi:hypothetical protein
LKVVISKATSAAVSTGVLGGLDATVATVVGGLDATVAAVVVGGLDTATAAGAVVDDAEPELPHAPRANTAQSTKQIDIRRVMPASVDQAAEHVVRPPRQTVDKNTDLWFVCHCSVICKEIVNE